MEFETILLKKEDHIATITLNRPERLNAINTQMERDLAKAIKDVSEDDVVHVLIVAGAGRAFCAGGDIARMPAKGKAPRKRGAEEIRRGFRTVHEIIIGLQKMEKPTIAMVNGVAAGGGFDLACACDLRIGSPNARFMVAFVRLGLVPGWGGTWFYPRVMGLGKAAEFLFTGDFCEAEEAYRIGLLNRLVAPEDLERETHALASKIANGPPIALRLAKMQLYHGLEMDLETAMKVAAACETITVTSQDHKEGVSAFRRKRAPVYKGV